MSLNEFDTKVFQHEQNYELLCGNCIHFTKDIHDEFCTLYGLHLPMREAYKQCIKYKQSKEKHAKDICI